ncbi:hypothetical protein IRJ41_007086 [Triplophysa rosa]|uniref:Uncharacterized protein n=1 Tax=Triplophysa rosa TaxID=992332 RepID=A0A9W7W9J3_TRIRA|nr:hypothetical protein IRJ41_007086 [Triplophysa rosa]
MNQASPFPPAFCPPLSLSPPWLLPPPHWLLTPCHSQAPQHLLMSLRLWVTLVCQEWTESTAWQSILCSLVLTNQQASNVVMLWQNLLDYDKQRVVFAAGHQSRVDTGRFRSPKKRQEFTPGVESVKRHAYSPPLLHLPNGQIVVV